MVNNHIVFNAYGSFGDVYPLLAIAKELSKDNTVTFIANAYFKSTVVQAGINFTEAGSEIEQLEARETEKSSGATFKGALARYQKLIASNYIRVNDIIRGLHRSNPQLLVVTHGAYSPSVPVCEALGLPVVMVHLAPSQICLSKQAFLNYYQFFGKNKWVTEYLRYPYARFLTNFIHNPRREFNKHRVNLGCKGIPGPIKQLACKLGLSRKNSQVPMLNVVKNIVLCPKWFCEPVEPEVEDYYFSGFPFFSYQNECENAKFDAFEAQYGKPIIFTPGSAVADLSEFCSAIETVCVKLKVPGVLLSRYGQSILSKIDNTNSFPFLHLSDLDLTYALRKSRLLVHHGGIGTAAQAIRAGIPQIIRPRMYDQPDNAFRVMENGLGGLLYSNGYSGEEIVGLYRHILQSDVHQSHLAYYANALRKENGVYNAAEAVREAIRYWVKPARVSVGRPLCEQTL